MIILQKSIFIKNYMCKDTIHLYCVPGMAANVSIFENLNLPEHYQVHFIPWEIPLKGETLQDYAQRLCSKVTEPNPILMGVSFGGIVIQEMSKFLKIKQLIVVSSVKTNLELPKRFKVAQVTKVHKLFPTGLVEKVSDWEQFFFNEKLKKMGKLYNKYLTITDKYYLDWSIDNIINWQQTEPIANTIHIHGESDAVFPIKNIKNCIKIPKATHAMIVYKTKWFNENLPLLIENEKLTI